MKKSALSDCRDVFHFLKRKHLPPGRSVICNNNDKPIGNPHEALKFAKRQWDEIFSVNAQGVPHQPIVDIVAPYIRDPCTCILPDLTVHYLFDAIQGRRDDAVGSFDGWRTIELKALPPQAFQPLVKLWTMVEQGVWHIPAIMKAAKLVMLPKPDSSSSQPIAKRLITLLSIQYLMYGRARFMHTIEWQNQTFPHNLAGGIKGRRVADIAHNIAARTELAVNTKEHIVAVKLDRSKCFDRVCPNVISALAQLLGLDPRLTRVWMDMYSGFQRFLTCGRYVLPEELENKNGIAQGDSLSVLAINVLMTCWIKTLSVFPALHIYAFVDDGCILTKNTHVAQLIQAVRATQLFDELCGQKLNLSKSCGFSTCKITRKSLAVSLPQLKIEDNIVLLGTCIKTNAKRWTKNASNDFHVLTIILHDIDSLPVGHRAKLRLIGSKVIPKLTFHPELNPWPRMTVEALEARIMKTIWGQRPMWRSSPLLFSILGNPLNLHPQSAIAGVTICNIVQRCHADPTFYQFWQAFLQCRKVISHGLVDMFIKAVGVLGLTFVPPFQLSWLEFPPTSLLDFTPRGLKALLRRAAAQALFTEALSSSRKNFVAGDSGVLDFDLAPPGPRRIKPWYQRLNAVDESMVLGPMAGALPTADRLYQAGGTSSPNCRFCGESQRGH